MPVTFDDLIPQTATKRRSISFDDLIPTGEEVSDTIPQESFESGGPHYVPPELQQAEEQAAIEAGGGFQVPDWLKQAVPQALRLPGKVALAAGGAQTGRFYWPTDEEVQTPAIPAKYMPPYMIGEAAESLFPNSQVAKGYGGTMKGVGEFMSGLTSPENLATLPLAPTGKLATRLVSGVFLGQAIAGTPEQWKAFNEADNPSDKFRIATSMGLGYAAPIVGGASTFRKPKAKPQSKPQIETVLDEGLDRRIQEAQRNVNEAAAEKRFADAVRLQQVLDDLRAEKVKSNLPVDSVTPARVQLESPKVVEPVRTTQESATSGEVPSTAPGPSVVSEAVESRPDLARIDPQRPQSDQPLRNISTETDAAALKNGEQSLQQRSQPTRTVTDPSLSESTSPPVSEASPKVASVPEPKPGKVLVAIRLKDGQVISAPSHSQAYDIIHDKGLSLAGSEEGFLSPSGDFLYRDEAFRKFGGSTAEDLKPKKPEHPFNQADADLLAALHREAPSVPARIETQGAAPVISKRPIQPGIESALAEIQRRNVPEPPPSASADRASIRESHSGAKEPPPSLPVEPIPSRDRTDLTQQNKLRFEARPESTTMGVPSASGISKIGKSIEAKAVEAKLTQGFEGTANFDPITIKDQAQRATGLIKSSLNDARAVIRGDAPLPEGLRGTSLITAMEEHISRQPNAELAYELANSPLVRATSEAAQEMRLMAERVPDGITAAFEEIKEARRAGSKQRGETPERVAQEIKAEVVRNVSKRPTWEAFVKSLECV